MKVRNRLFLICSLFFTFFITSCSDKVMGYSVALWNIPESQIQSGDTVPVYIKSNISHVYIIGTVDGQKVEVPLWKLTEPVKKNKIKNIAAKYADNAHSYASVKLDGLPCRAEAVNTSKQVYRLRKGEIIKILYKVNGQSPMSGKNPLEGNWYKILTSDGTQGCCFSYNLNIFETDINGNQIGGEVIEEEEEVDTLIETICSNVWYPDYFNSMIKSGNVDLAVINPAYKFTIDTEAERVSLNWEKIHQNWNYQGYTKTDDNQYTLTNIPVVITYKRSNYIVVRYTGESGKPQEFNYVTLDNNLEEVITAEKDRRTNSYLSVWTHGPIFKSSNYGRIVFNEDGTFQWSNYKLLVPNVIDATAKPNGTVSVKYALSKALAGSYDGVLTFKFTGMSKEVNFLYKIDDGALRLEDATGAKIDGNLIKERSSSPMILYFTVAKKQ